MNVIRVYGGIGNQLFQYAFGRAMRSPVSYNIGFYDEVKELKRKWPRPYRLNKFEIDIQLSNLLQQPTVNEHKVGFDKSLLTYRNHNFDGYWQYVDYYYEVREELKYAFHVKEEFYTEDFFHCKNIIESEQSIGVHVRRGDYLVQTWGILPTQYYFDAIKQVPDGPLFIFSDDIEWCKSVFKEDYFSRKIYFIHLEDYLDFGLLRFCNHIIMASSTFSWWAAFLCKGKVIAPSQWLGEQFGDTSLHYPSEWIKIQI